MIKSFSVGILLGIALTAGLMYFVPAVDQHREPSFISVQANGGNSEAFHVNLPGDRILLGAPGEEAPLPPGLAWPDDGRFDNSQTEVFKLRNRKDVVVGVASRIAGPLTGNGRIVEWTLHLPARGSLYASMAPAVDDSGIRGGRVLAGTREFSEMRGTVQEQVVAPSRSADAPGDGRIELVTALIGKAGDS